MFKKIARRASSISPQAFIIGLLVLVVGGAVAALLWSRSEPKAEALITPRAARVERVDGQVGVARAFEREGDIEWTEAELNTPLAVGDRIYADEDSRAAIAFTGRNYARLDPRSSLDVLSLSDARTQLALRSGSAIFDVGELAPGELFEVATPGGAVDFYEPGLYQVGIGDDGNTMISVLSGLAQVVGLAGSGQISKGEILTLVGQTAAQVLLSKIAPDLAGGLVDDYYGYRYPYSYDGRYSDYDYYLEDPYYYDPYHRSVSYQYLPTNIAGAYDLDYYGDWQEVDGYGRCWSPRVEDNWAPYRHGYWDVDEVWGPTWVADEPWGWAPYHYGRWAQVNGRWYWVPQEAVTRPVYSPAMVAFVPLAQTNQIAWVPLAPGEAYIHRYYDAGFNPHYLASPDVVTQVINIRQTYVNMSVPTAVTVVPVEQFTHYIEPGVIAYANPQLIAEAQPVLDPFAVESFRNAAFSHEGKRHRFKAPRHIEQRAFNTPVVTSFEPVMPPARRDLAQMLQARAVTEKQKRNKLKIDDTGQVVARSNYQMPNSQLQSQATARGDKAARREMKRLERAGRQAGVIAGQPGTPQAIQQAQAVQGKLPREARKAEKRAARQQQSVFAPASPQNAVTNRQQRKAQKQNERQQRQAVYTQQAAQAASQNRQQRKAEKRAVRQQSAQPQNNQRVIQQPAQPAGTNRQQRKAEKRVRQQQSVWQQSSPAVIRQPAPQVQTQRQARKVEKRAAQQQQAYQPQVRQQPQPQRQPVVVQQYDRQQRKAEKRAARQQAAQPAAAPQQQVYRAPQPAYKAPASSGAAAQTQNPAKAQRKAEKRAARAGKGN